jgi:hypothetical protein
MATIKKKNADGTWEPLQVIGEDMSKKPNVYRQTTEPDNVPAGTWWLDPSDNQFQGTVFANLDSKIEETNAQLAQTANDIDQRGVDIKKLGIKADGTDETTAIQTVLNEHLNVFFSDGTYVIDPAIGLSTINNQTITFSKNALIKNKAHHLTSYQMLRIYDKSNVTLVNPNLDGNRTGNTETIGEHGHGISLRGSTDAIITNPKIVNCWGDGIYLGAGVKLYCENTVIENPICDNNRRQGISVTSVKGLRLVNPRLLNTNGTDPQCGLDIEPNNTDAFMEDIKVINPYTENNKNQGIIVALDKFANSKKMVDITIENHTDKGSTNGFAVAKCAGGFHGEITLSNPYYEDNKFQAITIRDYDITGASIKIINPKIINCAADGNVDAKYNSGIVIFKEPADIIATTIGNVVIEKPVVIDNREIKKMHHAIYVRNLNNTALPVKKVAIYDPIELKASISTVFFYGNESIITDQFEVTKYSPDFTFEMRMNNYFKKFSNKNFTTSRTISLQQSIFEGYPEMTFVMEGTQTMVIDPTINFMISPLSTIKGQKVQSTKKGSSITIKKLDSDTWYVTNIVGEWTAVV